MRVTMVRQGRGVNKLVGGIFTVVGLALLGAGWRAGNRQYTILKSWPTLEAEVTNSRVSHHVSHDSKRNTDTTMYEAEIEFRYTVERKAIHYALESRLQHLKLFGNETHGRYLRSRNSPHDSSQSRRPE